MAQLPVDDLLSRCGSMYRLVILAARRAKELAEGAPALVQTRQHKAKSIALEAILNGKVLYKDDEATGKSANAKKTRSAKSKEEKRKKAA